MCSCVALVRTNFPVGIATANLVPSSPILFSDNGFDILPKRRFLEEPHVTFKKTAFLSAVIFPVVMYSYKT
jgi:hypothetical protein